MATVFEKFGPGWYQNYCTRPTVDVEILADVHHCELCAAEVTYRTTGDQWPYGRWEHVAQTGCPAAMPKIRCRFCRVEDGYDGAQVKYSQEAWADMTRCSRCGGVNGYGIGD